MTQDDVSPGTAPQPHADDRQAQNEKARAEREAARKKEIEAAPYVVLTVKSSGIHPSTSRAIIIDAVTLDNDGNQVDEFYAVLNPGGDPGPVHLHGLTHEEVKQGKRFSHILKTLGRIIDGRTLIVHNAPRTWGFISSEAKQAMASAARANRNRNRGRRRQRVGHIPRPATIVDTLATARRQGIPLPDIRIRSVAQAMNLDTTPATATLERAEQGAKETAREETMLTARTFFVQSAAGPLAEFHPNELRADKFGLQRTDLRVDAMAAPRPFENPGVYTPETGLIQGMEIVVAPEITMDPDIIIDALMSNDLAYSEKITRKSSLVVCNNRENLVGKSMHADRKNIPLLSDEEFMNIVGDVAPGTPAKETNTHSGR